MMAMELATGNERWQTPNPGGWGMTHSSVASLDHPAGRQYLYCSTRGVAGVAAADGRILWSRDDWVIRLATVPTPVTVGRDRIFLTGGYEAGSMMLRILEREGKITSEVLWRVEHTVFSAEQQTPILWKDHLYGIVSSGELACLDLEGELVWRTDREHLFGLGPYLLVDDALLLLADEGGILTLAEAAPQGYRGMASAKVLDGHDAWAPMALAEGRLILRDRSELVCLELPQR